MLINAGPNVANAIMTPTTPATTKFKTGYIGEYTIVNVPGCVNTIPYQLYTHMIFTHWMVTSATNPELITGWGTESIGRMAQVETKLDDHIALAGHPGVTESIARLEGRVEGIGG